MHPLRFYPIILCLSFLLLKGQAQTTDTTAIMPGPPVAHSPFKTITLERVSANGHKDSGVVDVVFTANNQSVQIASLIFSINPALSKAADDQDSIYPISQLRLGANKKDPDNNVITVELRPDQALHCGLYLAHVPLTARYIRKVVLFTSLRLDDAPQGEDNIILTNLEIRWK